MKRKKFLALALAGVLTAVTLTACAPLDALYDWFFGGGSGSASRSNGVNLVEDLNLKKQVMKYFELNDGDVTTDKSRKALEEVVGKLDAATMITNNQLNEKGQKALNEVAKSQLPHNSAMCIDVMEQPSARAAAADETPENLKDRTLYWAMYTDHGNGSTFGEGGKPGPETGLVTYESELKNYSGAKMSRNYYKRDSKVDLFVGTFTRNGKTYLAMVMIWQI